ncbi:MAG: hypothetical protein GF308_02780 [Candidatus Heimdallarchaeota archaeon]|nr:hypothetical protein [Candidatus Heimdallarchaeota archaeon]
MNQLVHWIRTGSRGARAEFTDADLITTLLLISQEPMGRYKLQEELELSENSTKNLLNFGKINQLLETTCGPTGHFLTKKGKELVSSIFELIKDYGKCPCSPFEKKEHYYILIAPSTRKKGKNSLEMISSWKIRDKAIANNGEAILFLKKKKTGDLDFPEPDIELKDFYPKFQRKIEYHLKIPIETNEFLLIVAAKTLQKARKSAFITTISMDKMLLEKVHNSYK